MVPELPRLPERYELGRLLGKGSVGRVFMALDRWSGENVAVKVLGDMPSGPTRGAWERCFEAEIRSASRLAHPRLVIPQDAGTTLDGLPFFIMPYIEGAHLSSLIATPPPWPVLLDLFDQLLDALAFSHARGVLHRDIKPQNLLIRPRPEGAPPGYDLFVVDLGLAYLRERYEEQAITKTEARGTPRYMAPEQLEGNARDFGPWTDLYAVGGILYEILHGEPPFVGGPMKVALAKMGGEAPPLVIRPGYHAPRAIEEVVACLLARQIHRRFALAADVRAALRALQSRPLLYSPTGSPRPRVIELPQLPPPEPRGRRPSLALAARREPPLVGREELRRHLWDAARQVQQTGAPLAVLLEGEAGFGKSRLCRWLMEALEREGAMRTLHVHSPAGAEGPHAGLLGAVRRHLRAANLKGDELRARLEFLLNAHDASSPREIDDLYRWLSSDEFGGGFALEKRAALVAGLLRREAWRGGTVLWLDEVAWAAPGEGLALVEQLLLSHERGEAAPFLILATARPEAYLERPVEGQIRERLLLRPDVLSLELAPLSPQERLALTEEIAPLEPNLAAMVAERSQGNPLYVLNLLAYWVRGNLLEETFSEETKSVSLRLRPISDTEDIFPPDIASLFETRVRETIRRSIDPRATRLALWGAALLGVEFPVVALEHALDTLLDPERARLGIRAAWDGGLLRGGRRYAWGRFDHPSLWDHLRRSAEASPEGRNLAEICNEARLTTEVDPIPLVDDTSKLEF